MRIIKVMAAVAMIGILYSGQMAKADDLDTPVKSTVLTDASLRTMLEALGYEVKLEKLEKATLNWIIHRRNPYDFHLNVNLSIDKTKLWTSVALAEFKPDHEAQASRLLKLLELNQQIGPAHFYYLPSQKQLFAARVMDNRNITARDLRNHLDHLMDKVMETESAWNTKVWAVETAPTTKVNGK